VEGACELWGTKWVTLLSGVSTKYMRQFYISVTVLRMLYVADLFLIPSISVSKGTKSFIAKLAWVQRQASLHTPVP